MAKWDKPKLTVLARNKPEEAVLEACKTETGGGPMQEIAAGKNDISNFCEYLGPYNADACATDAAS